MATHASSSQSIAALLEGTTVHELLGRKKNAIPLVAIAATATVEDAFDRLLAKDVTSLPVYASSVTGSTTASQPASYIGFVSAYDLLVFLQPDVS